MSNLIPQAYRDLKKYLGRQDAFIELQELAFREIIAQSEAHPDSAHAFFDEMSRKHGLYTNLPDANKVHEEIGRIYVLLAFGAVERFLAAFGNEVSSPTLDCWPRPHFELSAALQAIRAHFAGNECHTHLLELIEYYRLVRNEAAHPYDSSQHVGELKTQHPKICTPAVLKFLDEKYNHKAPPNVSYRLAFEDFILCSRVCKDFALAVCRSFQPDVEQCIRNLQNDWNERFSCDAQNPKRRRNRQLSELRTKFGLDDREAAYILDSVNGF